MTYPVKDYAQTFMLNGKFWSVKTIIRRCQKGQLPANHKPIKVGRNYAIDVLQKFESK